MYRHMYGVKLTEMHLDDWTSAHRMRTVAGADKVVVLSEGTVAEQGNSGMLLKKNGWKLGHKMFEMGKGF